MVEDLTILTMKELKEEIRNNLEYSDPHDPFFCCSNIKLSPSMKPVVRDKFFETDTEAVAYVLKIDELYELVKDCADGVKVVESYDEDDELAPYTIYERE